MSKSFSCGRCLVSYLVADDSDPTKQWCFCASSFKETFVEDHGVGDSASAQMLAELATTNLTNMTGFDLVAGTIDPTDAWLNGIPALDVPPSTTAPLLERRQTTMPLFRRDRANWYRYMLKYRWSVVKHAVRGFVRSLLSYRHMGVSAR